MKKRNINPAEYSGYFNKGIDTMIIKMANVRLAFPSLFEAKAINDGSPKFSAAFLIPKTNKALIKEINEAVLEVATAKWGAKASAVLKAAAAKGRNALHDGTEKEGYAGYDETVMFINATNGTRPLVVDRDKSPLTAADGRPYAGCYVNASIELWAQDNKYGKAVNASLRGVQFFKDGDSFSGGGVADEGDFDDLADGADAGDDDDLA